MHLSTFVMIGLLLGAELPAQPLPTDTFELRLRQLPPPALPPFALSEYRLVSKTRNSGQGPYGLPVDTSLTLGSLVGEQVRSRTVHSATVVTAEWAKSPPVEHATSSSGRA